ncbi:RagB/SusD family nutrient uptake outer membrane protein [Bacteroides sp. GM023]|uniref:RagB/SusD family nutrient uptake outer membrane protein n=1 Tax=Bacteroides sp. GM023 TaxID=2723058 RepID=UPI00168B5B89|nr:RagB/SusD family nutrient uptake outer membrane protein [Bacteroides sp. GM023]MBD3588380.1 RagB/SusD family nutrient uptake outer membrane protein [Bacteroides sp. GM023]
MKKIITFFLGLCCIIAACTETSEGFLDSKGKETTDLESVFEDSVKVMGFHAALFWQVGRATMSPHGVPSSLTNYKDYEAGTDNSRYTAYFRVTEFTPAYTKGDFSQGGTNANFTDFRTGWMEAWQTIYRCNSFLQNYKRAPLTDATKEKLAYEARFIRSFFLFHLLRQYGSVPLVYDEVIDPFNPTLLARSTFEDCVNYIAQELRIIAEALPLVQDGADYGRPTRASALGVLTELYALAASPLYNGGNIGSGDNRLLVGYDNYDVNRWQNVVIAAKELMNLGTHELVIDNKTRPGNGFYLATTKRVNSERVWFWVTVNTTCFPGSALLPNSRSGGRQLHPYHELVEAFPMKDGTAIDKNKADYKKSPYANRDPRLGFTIIHNESEWAAVADGKPEKVYTYKNAPKDGYGVSSGTATGYYFRKCLVEGKLGSGSASYGEGTGLSFIRYADIMLLYAEALTELDIDRNRTEIEKQLFEIRDRAGIDAGDNKRYGIPANMNKDKMIEFIINERRIEFANECGNRFWDLKRRKLYEKLDGVWTNAAIWELDNEGVYTWTVLPIEQHFFSKKMYFSAIPQREINASHGMLIQNPDW